MTTTIAAIIYGVCFGGTGLFILHFLEKMFKQSVVPILPYRLGVQEAMCDRAGVLKLV